MKLLKTKVLYLTELYLRVYGDNDYDDDNDDDDNDNNNNNSVLEE